MSTDTREERLARRIADLYATDQQFADAGRARPSPRPSNSPIMRLPQVVQTVIDGYADRPALGQRAVEFVTDPRPAAHPPNCCPGSTPSPTAELSDRVSAVATALTQSPVRPGDRVAHPGLHQRRLHHHRHGAAAAGRGVGAAADQRAGRRSCSRSSPRPSRSLIASSIDYPRRRRRTGARPATVPSGWWCSTTTPRWTTSGRHSQRGAGTRLAEAPVIVETLGRGARPRRDALPVAPAYAAGRRPAWRC